MERKGRNKERILALEARVAVQSRALNEANRRIDKLVVLVTDHEVQLNAMRDKSDKCEGK